MATEALAPVLRIGIQKAFLCEQIELRDPDGNRIRVMALDRFSPTVER